jgi:hypothetical protein
MHQNLLSQLLAVNDTVGRKAAPSIVICSTVDSFAVSFLQGIEGIKNAMFECLNVDGYYTFSENDGNRFSRLLNV